MLPAYDSRDVIKEKHRQNLSSLSLAVHGAAIKRFLFRQLTLLPRRYFWMVTVAT